MKSTLKRARRAFAQDKFAECAEYCQAILADDPASFPALELLSQCFAHQGGINRAIVLTDRLLQLAGEDTALKAQLHATQGGYSMALDGHDKAGHHYRTAVELEPEAPFYRALLLAFLYLNGRPDEAAEESPVLLRTLGSAAEVVPEAQRSKMAQGLHLCALTASRTTAASLLEEMKALPDAGGNTWLREDSLYVFALASLMERLGMHQQALEHFTRANALRRADAPYDIDATLGQMDEICQTFSPEFFASEVEAQPREGEPRVIFILGMPRSGTTLVEQVFASHSEVTAAGETPALSQSLASVLQQRADCDPSRPDSLDARFFESVRRLYLRSLNLPRKCRVVTDKMPANVMYLWLIRKAFPDARVVLCRREKYGTVLSCFTTSFANLNRFSESLADCAAYYDKTYEVTDRWRESLGPFLRQQEYEALVADPEIEIAALLSHASLEPEEACFTPHLSDRVVATASIMQVTKPIYGDANQRWEPFRQFLGEQTQLFAGEGV